MAASKDFRHRTPDALQAALDRDPVLNAKWADLTDLARNEWVCWITSAKKPETREARFARLEVEVRSGKRRPCCWPGCPHRLVSVRKWSKLELPGG